MERPCCEFQNYSVSNNTAESLSYPSFSSTQLTSMSIGAQEDPLAYKHLVHQQRQQPQRGSPDEYQLLPDSHFDKDFPAQPIPSQFETLAPENFSSNSAGNLQETTTNIQTAAIPNQSKPNNRQLPAGNSLKDSQSFKETVDYNIDDSKSDLKVFSYYKGLINDSFDSLENQRFNTLIQANDDSVLDHSQLENISEQDVSSNAVSQPTKAVPSPPNNEENGSNQTENKNKSPNKSTQPTVHATPELPNIKTPVIGAFKGSVSKNAPNSHHGKFSMRQQNELSPLVFIDSPVRTKYQAKNLSIIEDASYEFNDGFDLRSLKDGEVVDGLTYTFQYINENSNSRNDRISSEVLHKDELHDTKNVSDESNYINDSNSLNDIPFMKNASMSDYDFNEILTTPSKPPVQSAPFVRPSLPKLPSTNSIRTKESNSSFNSVLQNKPKLKNVKSLPQLSRLNSFKIKRKNTLGAESKNATNNIDYLLIPAANNDDSSFKSGKLSNLSTPHGKKIKTLTEKPSISSFTSQQMYNYGDWSGPSRHAKKHSVSKTLSHSRFNSNSSSIDKGNSSIKNFNTAFHTMDVSTEHQVHNHKSDIDNENISFLVKNISVAASLASHRKSSSNSLIEKHYIPHNKSGQDLEKLQPLPKLNTSSSATNVFEKLKSGIRKISGPISPRNGSFSQQLQQQLDQQSPLKQQLQHKYSIDTISSPLHGSFSHIDNTNTINSTFADRAKFLVKKKSISNQHKSKATKLPNRSKSNTINSQTTDDSVSNTWGLSIVDLDRKNGIFNDISANGSSAGSNDNSYHYRGSSATSIVAATNLTSDAATAKGKITPPLASPVIKVSALSSRFSDFHFNTNSSIIDNVIFDSSYNISKNSIPVKASLQSTRAMNGKQQTPAKDKEAVKNRLIDELTVAIERMQIEDEAFETTQKRLEESGWYSQSNINDIKKRREIVRVGWQEKIKLIKVKLDKLNELDKRIDYNIKTPKKSVDNIEKFNFET